LNIIGIIPARLKSTRLKEKLLIKVKKKPLIQHVYENAVKARSIKKLYVATDSAKIKKAVEAAGGSVIMTSKKCRSGTERIKEALKTVRANINDIIVNIQGDEPLLEPEFIDRAVYALVKDRKFDASTLAVVMRNKKEINDPSCVKVVTGSENEALYFSRAAIPFSRDKRPPPASILKHLGLYVYRKPVLDRWNRLKSKYEKIERLEQLRMIENGCRVRVVTVKSRSVGIDTGKDLKLFKKRIRA